MMSDLDALPEQTPPTQNEAARREQLRKWECSDTATVTASVKDKKWKITFPLELLFLSACESGDVEYAKELLSMGVDINVKNSDGLAALHQATVNTDEDMINFLLESGADVDVFDNEGWTPLHAAASVGSLPFVKILIENGANPASVNHDGDTPCDLIRTDDDEGVTEYLEDVIKNRGIDLDQWKQAEEKQMRNDSAKWLRERNLPSISQKHPETGATPLHVAASKGFVEVMRNLLRGGADPDAEDKDGWTPLHAAAHWSLPEAARVLTEYSANFKAKNKNGHTPKDLAEGDMLTVLNELEDEQQDLIESRKLNTKDEIEESSLGRPILNVRRLSSKLPSVSRISMNEKENLGKLDKEFEKIEIRKQATALPAIPGTPATPPDEVLPSRTRKASAVIEEDSQTNNSESVASSKDVPNVKNAEVVSPVTSTSVNEETRVSEGEDDTASMVSSITSSTREPENDGKPVVQSSTGESGKPESSSEGAGGAFDEIVRELEASDKDKSESVSSVASSTTRGDVGGERVKRRVDKVETVPLKSTSLQINRMATPSATPFSSALLSNSAVPLPKPSLTVSKAQKESKVPDSNTRTHEVAPESVEIIPTSPKEENPPSGGELIGDNEGKAKTIDADLLKAEDKELDVNEKENENESANNRDGRLERAPSWRVKRNRESKDPDAQSTPRADKPSQNSDQSVESTPPINTDDASESEQLTPKRPASTAIMLPKVDEKEVQRRSRARFERATRRSTQGVSASDLEEAMAAPHHHPIREDKKQVRERAESKFLPVSPGLTSPVPHASSASSSSKQLENNQGVLSQGDTDRDATAPQNEGTPVAVGGVRPSNLLSRHPSSLSNTPNDTPLVSSLGRYRDRPASTVAASAQSASMIRNNSLRSRLNDRVAGSLAEGSKFAFTGRENRQGVILSGASTPDQTDFTNSDPWANQEKPKACDNCQQHVSWLESEVRRLSNELNVFRNAAKWDEVQKEKQERVQLMDRVSQLEVQLAEFDSMAKNYSKVRNENASLIRLLANFVRTEYNIPSGRRPASSSSSPQDTAVISNSNTPVVPHPAPAQNNAPPHPQ